MKRIKFSLFINGSPIRDIGELRSNISPEILTLYSDKRLYRWLNDSLQLKDYASAVDQIKSDSEMDTLKALYDIFGINEVPNEYSIGYMYATGSNVPINEKEATRWFTKIIDQNLPLQEEEKQFISYFFNKSRQQSGNNLVDFDNHNSDLQNIDDGESQFPHQLLVHSDIISESRNADSTRLAFRMRSSSSLDTINKSNPIIYNLNLDHYQVISNQTWINSNGQKEDSRIAKCQIGEPNINKPTEKVLMILGATGSGKTTLINGVANYILGAKWEDDFRFKLIEEKFNKSKDKGQTIDITAYTFNHMDGGSLPYKLTIIDTPGFGDESGIKKDKFIEDRIRDFFTGQNGIKHIDGIGIVAQSPLERLTPPQKYIFDAVLSIFGKDICDNIFMMITFCDAQKPPVIEAITAAKVPYQKYFKFNNSALYANKTGDADDAFNTMFWEMGVNSFRVFFDELSKMSPRSLVQTAEVLKERRRLEAIIDGLQPRINEGLSQISVLKQTKNTIEQRAKEIETNKDFIYTVDVPKSKQVNTNKVNTTCMACHMTCHLNCSYEHDSDKDKCVVMKDGNCEVCGHHWSEHKNTPFIYENYIEKETRTSKELEEKYYTATKGKSKAEEIYEGLLDELEKTEDDVLLMINNMQKCLHRLEEIALKPNPLTSLEYIKLLIEAEKREKKEGWEERLNYYEIAIKRAEVIDFDKNQDVNMLLQQIKKLRTAEKKKGNSIINKIRYW